MRTSGQGMVRQLLIDKKLTLLFVAFSVIYFIQTILQPKDPSDLEKYDLTSGQLTALLATIILPYLIIWFIALGGYVNLRSYTSSILKAKDGSALSTIARGLLILALWMPVSAIFGTQATIYYQAHPEATPTLVILNNYLNILLLFAAFFYIHRGTEKLIGVVKKTSVALPQWFLLGYIALSALYIFLVMHDPARQHPSGSVEVASYYLPDWLIVTTIVIPRLITWFLGAQAVYNIVVYCLRVKGKIYKEALYDLAKGIGWVVVAIILLRCFQSLSTQLNELGLGLILLIIYALLVAVSTGYIFIARGARNLKQIEDL